MDKGRVYTMPFRRKREGRTNYKKRLKLLMSDKFRFVARKSLRNLQVSIVKYNKKGDMVLFTVSSNNLKKFGWEYSGGNTPSAYLTGFLAGKRALENGVNEAILDIGFSNSSKGSTLYATLAGAIDAGLKIPHDISMLPSKDRLSGAHIAKYAQSLKGNSAEYKKQFSGYTKKSISPENITNNFNTIKGKIHGKEKN